MPDISGLIGHFPYLGLFGLLLLGGFGLPFPEDATLIFCGFLFSRHAINPFYALPVVYAGLLSSDVMLYFWGRKYGRRILSHPRFHRILPPEKLSVLEARFNRHSILFIVFGRHIVGLRGQVFLVAGIMRMPLLKFIVTDSVSAVFSVAVMVGAGYMGGRYLGMIKDYLRWVKYAGIAIIPVAVYLIFKYLKSKKNSPL
ncbi:MAG: DedA family protein [Deltaproteobacteria bacterium]|nr:DedA family protein [Deltaproteobacteria bacterium]